MSSGQPTDLASLTTRTLAGVSLTLFVDARWLAPGSFAAITDVALPWVAEGMSAFDRIVIDDVAQEATMPQSMVQPDLVSGDITGLVNGDIEGRGTDTERTAFVFRGLALGDLALAGLAYQRATKELPEGSGPGMEPTPPG